MKDHISHLVVNYLKIEDDIILVGATDNLRWKWDIEEEMSGDDSKTIVYVTLIDNGNQFSISEEAGFHSLPGDPTRPLAMSHLFELFEIAWIIKNENLKYIDARERFFGKVISKN